MIKGKVSLIKSNKLNPNTNFKNFDNISNIYYYRKSVFQNSKTSFFRRKKQTNTSMDSGSYISNYKRNNQAYNSISEETNPSTKIKSVYYLKKNTHNSSLYSNKSIGQNKSSTIVVSDFDLYKNNELKRKNNFNNRFQKKIDKLKINNPVSRNKSSCLENNNSNHEKKSNGRLYIPKDNVDKNNNEFIFINNEENNSQLLYNKKKYSNSINNRLDFTFKKQGENESFELLIPKVITCVENKSVNIPHNINSINYINEKKQNNSKEIESNKGKIIKFKYNGSEFYLHQKTKTKTEQNNNLSYKNEILKAAKIIQKWWKKKESIKKLKLKIKFKYFLQLIKIPKIRHHFEYIKFKILFYNKIVLIQRTLRQHLEYKKEKNTSIYINYETYGRDNSHKKKESDNFGDEFINNALEDSNNSKAKMQKSKKINRNLFLKIFSAERSYKKQLFESKIVYSTNNDCLINNSKICNNICYIEKYRFKDILNRIKLIQKKTRRFLIDTYNSRIKNMYKNIYLNHINCFDNNILKRDNSYITLYGKKTNENLIIEKINNIIININAKKNIFQITSNYHKFENPNNIKRINTLKETKTIEFLIKRKNKIELNNKNLSKIKLIQKYFRYYSLTHKTIIKKPKLTKEIFTKCYKQAISTNNIIKIQRNIKTLLCSNTKIFHKPCNNNIYITKKYINKYKNIGITKFGKKNYPKIDRIILNKKIIDDESKSNIDSNETEENRLDKFLNIKNSKINKNDINIKNFRNIESIPSLQRKNENNNKISIIKYNKANLGKNIIPTLKSVIFRNSYKEKLFNTKRVISEDINNYCNTQTDFSKFLYTDNDILKFSFCNNDSIFLNTSFGISNIDNITKIKQFIIKCNMKMITKAIKYIYKDYKKYIFIDSFIQRIQKNNNQFVFNLLFKLNNKTYFYSTIKRHLRVYNALKKNNKNEDNDLTKLLKNTIFSRYLNNFNFLYITSLNEKKLIETSLFKNNDKDLINYFFTFYQQEKKHLDIIWNNLAQFRLIKEPIYNSNIFGITKYMDILYNNIINGNICKNCFCKTEEKCSIKCSCHSKINNTIDLINRIKNKFEKNKTTNSKDTSNVIVQNNFNEKVNVRFSIQKVKNKAKEINKNKKNNCESFETHYSNDIDVFQKMNTGVQSLINKFKINRAFKEINKSVKSKKSGINTDVRNTYTINNLSLKDNTFIYNEKNIKFNTIYSNDNDSLYSDINPKHHHKKKFEKK